MIDANIFPVLIDIQGKAEFKTRKEAAWALGHHQCIQWWHGWADQVPCQPGMYTATVRPAHRHGQQDCAGQASWSLGDIAIGENGAMNLNINLVDSQLIFYLDFFFQSRLALTRPIVNLKVF